MAVGAAGLGELLIYDPSGEEDHLEKLDYNPEYNSKLKKLYNVLKKVVGNGSVNSKVRTFDKTKYGVLNYSYIWKYYDMEGNKRVYGHTELEDLLQLEIHYNSPVGFDDYLSNSKYMCQKLE